MVIYASAKNKKALRGPENHILYSSLIKDYCAIDPCKFSIDLGFNREYRSIFIIGDKDAWLKYKNEVQHSMLEIEEMIPTCLDMPREWAGEIEPKDGGEWGEMPKSMAKWLPFVHKILPLALDVFPDSYIDIERLWFGGGNTEEMILNDMESPRVKLGMPKLGYYMVPVPHLIESSIWLLQSVLIRLDSGASKLIDDHYLDEPPKLDRQMEFCVKLLAMGNTQAHVAEILTKHLKLKRPMSQSKVSRWRKIACEKQGKTMGDYIREMKENGQYKLFEELVGTGARPAVISFDGNGIEFGPRTDGRRGRGMAASDGI